jgi:hypothetical protein
VSYTVSACGAVTRFKHFCLEIARKQEANRDFYKFL